MTFNQLQEDTSLNKTTQVKAVELTIFSKHCLGKKATMQMGQLIFSAGENSFCFEGVEPVGMYGGEGSLYEGWLQQGCDSVQL